MKKDLFWKVMAVLFFIWLCVWLWSNSNAFIKFQWEGGIVMYKINKFTNAIYIHAANQPGKWIKLPVKEK